jgi:predicted TIM-barrel fold metal-dependent hydrolase
VPLTAFEGKPAIPAEGIAGHSVVDADVHHGTLDLVGALSPYLSRTYRERLADYGFPLGHGSFADDGGVRGWRPDLVEAPPVWPAGGAMAWDIDSTRNWLFKEQKVAIAVLTGGAMNGAQSMPDLDYASALCRAFNEWTRDTWLAADSRFRFAMSICTQDIDGAVAEIDRIGSDPRVCGVLFPTGSSRPFGHRTFEPLHAALERHRLPLILHRGGDGDGVFDGFTTGAGTPSHFIEAVVARPALYEVHLESLIFEAVFERHRTLRVVLLAAGFTWLPPYLWRMDLDWKGLRWHTPWVRRLSSEYVLERAWLGTGPFAEVPRGEPLIQTMNWLRGQDRLLFASGYPQWDADLPEVVATALPEPAREAVLAGNARLALRL